LIETLTAGRRDLAAKVPAPRLAGLLRPRNPCASPLRLLALFPARFATFPRRRSTKALMREDVFRPGEVRAFPGSLSVFWQESLARN